MIGSPGNVFDARSIIASYIPETSFLSLASGGRAVNGTRGVLAAGLASDVRNERPNVL